MRPVLAASAVKCPDCGSFRHVVVSTEAELCCVDCGLVLDTCMFDEAPNCDIGGEMDSTGGDNTNVYVSTVSTSTDRRLMQLNAMIAPRQKGRGFPEMDNWVACLGLSDTTIALAMDMYAAFSAVRRTTGEPRRAAFGACVHFAVKSSGVAAARAAVDRACSEFRHFPRHCNTVREVLLCADRQRWQTILLDDPRSSYAVMRRMVKACSFLEPQASIERCSQILETLRKKNVCQYKNTSGVVVCALVAACGGTKKDAIISACKEAGFVVFSNEFDATMAEIKKHVSMYTRTTE